MDKVFYDLFEAGKCTQEDLSIATGLTILAVRQLLFKAKLKLSNTVTDAWIEEMRMLPPEGTMEDQARQYITDMMTIRKLRYGVTHERQLPDRTRLMGAVMEGNKTQAELAKEFGLSQSTVSRHNPKRRRNKTYRERLTATDWRKVKQYLAENNGNISEAARHFNTTRQTIYRKLNNDN